MNSDKTFMLCCVVIGAVFLTLANYHLGLAYVAGMVVGSLVTWRINNV